MDLMKIKMIAEMASYGLSCLTLLATFVVKLTPSKKDDEQVGKIRDAILKATKYLPTLGVNPQTKALEQEVERLKNS